MHCFVAGGSSSASLALGLSSLCRHTKRGGPVSRKGQGSWLDHVPAAALLPVTWRTLTFALARGKLARPESDAFLFRTNRLQAGLLRRTEGSRRSELAS